MPIRCQSDASFAKVTSDGVPGGSDTPDAYERQQMAEEPAEEPAVEPIY